MTSYGQTCRNIYYDESTFSEYSVGYGRLFIIQQPKFTLSPMTVKAYYQYPYGIREENWYQFYRSYQSYDRSETLHDGFNEKVSQLLNPPCPSVAEKIEIYNGSELTFSSFSVRPFDPFET